MKILQIQTSASGNALEDIAHAEHFLNRAMDRHPELVCLGEMFCCPYDTKAFPDYAEEEGGETWQALSAIAEKYHVILSAGTVPERDEEGRIYNTAYVFDKDGRQLAKYRKMHLFDVDIEGGQHFHESETLTPGDSTAVFDTAYGKTGICICFDSRFPEQFRTMALKGAGIILVPAAFNMSTGPMHWELLHRSNALSSQCFIIATSTARNMQASYHAWGHSMICSPWGKVIHEMDEREGCSFTEIDLSEVQEVRKQIPLLTAIREEAY